MPKVSVIIPVYNAEKFVKQCLKSCTAQTLQDIEIIVVDDKSTDNTVSLVKNFVLKDNRIKLIELPQNKKQGYARNIATEQAEADYVMFLDVDDKYEPDCVEKMYNKIVQDNADMTVCRFKTINNKNENISDKQYLKNLTDIPKSLYSGFSYKDLPPQTIFETCNAVWDKIYKKSFLTDNDIKFPVGMYCEDDVFSVKAFFLAKKISVLNEALIYYRINRLDSTNNVRNEDAFDCFKMMEYIQKDLKNMDIPYIYKHVFIIYKVSFLINSYNSIKRKYKKQFYIKMQGELYQYKTLLEKQKVNKKNLFYNRLNLILSNNYYMYEIKKFLSIITGKKDYFYN